MSRRKGKLAGNVLSSRFYRNTQHSCGRCKIIPKILLKVSGWDRKMCISCVKNVARNLGMTVHIPTKKQLKPKKRRRREAA